MLLGKLDQAVDRGLHVAAAGMWLDAGAQDFKIFSQVAASRARDWIARIRGKKTVASFQNCAGPSKTFRGKFRGQDSVLRGEAGMQPLGPRAIRQKLQGACGHAAGDARRRKAFALR